MRKARKYNRRLNVPMEDSMWREINALSATLGESSFEIARRAMAKGLRADDWFVGLPEMVSVKIDGEGLR